MSRRARFVEGGVYGGRCLVGEADVRLQSRIRRELRGLRMSWSRCDGCRENRRRGRRVDHSRSRYGNRWRCRQDVLRRQEGSRWKRDYRRGRRWRKLSCEGVDRGRIQRWWCGSFNVLRGLGWWSPRGWIDCWSRELGDVGPRVRWFVALDPVQHVTYGSGLEPQ
ncbi:hypothetical protein CRG98_041366 [Punica granatum]|uniref:Uncharacterized protein n=1 Tax=Punica granatum TaxID=22663 RepID=A0A2I0I330_PUNGR|nr:hypothetical protein CRG98_041366 [Punica granatum]